MEIKVQCPRMDGPPDDFEECDGEVSCQVHYDPGDRDNPPYAETYVEGSTCGHDLTFTDDEIDGVIEEAWSKYYEGTPQ